MIAAASLQVLTSAGGAALLLSRCSGAVRHFAAPATSAAAQYWNPNEYNRKLQALSFDDLSQLVESRHKTGPQKVYRLIQLLHKAETPQHFEEVLTAWRRERTLRSAQEDHRPFDSHAAQALFKAGFRVGADEKVLDVLLQAREYSIQPTRRMLEGLIYRLGRNQQWDLLERAYLYACVYQGKPTKTMLSNMIQAYAAAGNLDRVNGLLAEAKGMNVQMDQIEEKVAKAGTSTQAAEAQ